MQSRRGTEKRFENRSRMVANGVASALFINKQKLLESTLIYCAASLFALSALYMSVLAKKWIKLAFNKASSLLFGYPAINIRYIHMYVYAFRLIASRSTVLGSKDSHSCARYFNLPAIRPWMVRVSRAGRAEPPASKHLPKSTLLVDR